MIKYIISNNINNILIRLLPQLSELTYINSTSPEILLKIEGLDHSLINYEFLNNLQQMVGVINRDTIVIENLLKYNLDEFSLVQLFKKLGDIKQCYIVDNRKIGFIELLCDEVVTV